MPDGVGLIAAYALKVFQKRNIAGLFGPEDKTFAHDNVTRLEDGAEGALDEVFRLSGGEAMIEGMDNHGIQA